MIKPKHLLFLWCPIFFMHSGGLFAQFNSAQTKMEKGKWESARQQLLKSLRKDSLSIESKFGLAQWYAASQNPEMQIDSSYYYITSSLADYGVIPARQKEKLKRNDLDSINLLRFRDKVDSMAFARATKFNTENSYNNFLKTFASAKQREKAIALRDEICFQEAAKINTYKSYHDYLERYPDSKRKEDARSRYNQLLVDEKTRDKKLKSYISFFKEYPSSPYRKQVEEQIFEISTADGEPSSYLKFIHDYPVGLANTAARNTLFYLIHETDEKLPAEILSDSLKSISKLNALYWIPVLKEKKFGFMDAHGTETMQPQFESIKDDYKCGPVKDDLLVTNKGIIGRDGTRISDSKTIINDIGFGFLKIGDSTCLQLLHKSGKLTIQDCFQDCEVVGGHYLAVKHGEKYALYAFNGRRLLEAQWQSIRVIEGVVVLSRMGKSFVYTRDQINNLADGNELPQESVFDEVKPFDAGLLLVRNGSLEGLLNSHLEFVVPLDRQVLEQTTFGLLKRKDDHFTLNGLTPALEQQRWDKMKYYKQWLFLQQKDKQVLVDLVTRKVIGDGADSIWFDKGLAFVLQIDSLEVFASSEPPIRLSKKAKITFIKSRNSVRYFYSDIKAKKAVFDLESGKRLFIADFEQIESLNASVFMIVRKNKKGLLGKNGKAMLPAEYDAIIANQNHYLSLLKDKKFGLYDLEKHRLIKPMYDRNLISLNEEILIAFMDDHYGLMGWDSKPLTKFEFDEIQPWSDEIILVRKNYKWQLYDFRSDKLTMENINDFHWIRNHEGDKVMLAHRDNYFGVVDNKKGVVIPLTFSEIINLGTEEEPLYFTDKDIEEAEIHVVIYYNSKGELIRKQVYEEEEFSHIYCDDN